MLLRLVREARRRRVFQTAALYVVGAWLTLQVADVLFPGFGIPDTAIRALVWATLLGFPVALVFGWLFDVGAHGIQRTPPATQEQSAQVVPLARSDYLILAALALVVAAIVLRTSFALHDAPRDTPAADTVDTAAGSQQKPEHSIAVLPFTNISNDPDNEYFCHGISEEILNRLGSVSGLRVIGRTSSFAFEDSGMAIPKLSALLGVRYLLQGSVRKSGAHLRISTQLLEESGLQVWSQTFDRELANVFAIQSEIAEAVAATVAPQVAPRVTAEREPDIEAYEHYLRGREQLHQRDLWGAREQLAQAIAIDPEFAEAHAELAIALEIGSPTTDQLDRARAAIARARALRPGLLSASAAEGLLLMAGTPPDYPAAERVLREVLARDPNMSDALNWLSNALDAQGRADEALAVLQRAVLIDPLHPSIADNLARHYVERGEPARAEELLLRQLEQPNPGDSAFYNISDFYQNRGQLVGVHEIAKRMLLEGDTKYYWMPVLSYALLGDWEHAAYWAERTRRELPEYFDSPFLGAVVPMYQGRYDEAANELRRVMSERHLAFADLDPVVRMVYGPLPALAGDCGTSIAALEPQLIPRPEAIVVPDGKIGDEFFMDAWHTLAWCYAQRGDEERGRQILDQIERIFAGFDPARGESLSREMHMFARNALLQGRIEVAMERLERAVADGWRDYFLYAHNPLWSAAWQHPRYVQLMTEVSADIARQRQEVERLGAGQDLIALYEARLEADRAAGAPPRQ